MWQLQIIPFEWPCQVAVDIFTSWTISSLSPGFNKCVFKQLNILQSYNLTDLQIWLNSKEYEECDSGLFIFYYKKNMRTTISHIVFLSTKGL
jgi:hypothetical protein